MSDQHPALSKTASDHAAAVLQALTSPLDLIMPGAGSVFGVLIGEVIPNQRWERAADLLSKTTKRVAAIEKTIEGLDFSRRSLAVGLFEEGLSQAAKSSTEERRLRIAHLLANGMTGTERQAAHATEMLRLLGETGDADLAMLATYAGRGQTQPPPQAPDPLPDRAVMMEALSELQYLESLRRRRLAALGLIELPVTIDPRLSGSVRGASYLHNGGVKVTELGRALLKEIGL